MSTPEDPEAAADRPAPMARRRFLHGLSRDTLSAAVQAAGLAVGAQRMAGEMIGSAIGAHLLAGSPSDEAPVGPALVGPAVGSEPVTERPFRIDGRAIRLLDVQRYPAERAEVVCASARDVGAAMTARQILGATVLGELAAYSMWLAVMEARDATIAARRTRIRTIAAALRGARPNVASIDHALRWMVDAWDSAAATDADDAQLEAACRAAADALATRLTTDRATSAQLAAGLLGARVEGTIRLLTLGGEGVPDAVAAGGAAGVAVALARSGRRVEVVVLETSVDAAAARVTAWSVAAAGIPVTIVADAAAGAVLARGDADAVVVGADRVLRDGSLVAAAGTYPVAVLARRHGVPLLLVAPSAIFDPEGEGVPPLAVRPEASLQVDPRRPGSVVRSTRAGTRGDLQDVTPPELVSVAVTEAGQGVPPSPIAGT